MYLKAIGTIRHLFGSLIISVILLLILKNVCTRLNRAQQYLRNNQQLKCEEIIDSCAFGVMEDCLDFKVYFVLPTVLLIIVSHFLSPLGFDKDFISP